MFGVQHHTKNNTKKLLVLGQLLAITACYAYYPCFLLLSLQYTVLLTPLFLHLMDQRLTLRLSVALT